MLEQRLLEMMALHDYRGQENMYFRMNFLISKFCIKFIWKKSAFVLTVRSSSLFKHFVIFFTPVLETDINIIQ